MDFMDIVKIKVFLQLLFILPYLMNFIILCFKLNYDQKNKLTIK